MCRSRYDFGEDLMKLSVVDGDITEQNVDVIVNAWNRNLFPWWTEFPHGVNYAIRRR